MKDSPCFKCEKRTPTCRPDCREYIAWRKAQDERVKKIKSEKERERVIEDYRTKAIEKSKKQSNRSKMR